MPRRLLTPEQERSLLAEVELRRRLSDKALAPRYGLSPKQLKGALNYARNRCSRDPDGHSGQSAERE